MEEAVSGDGGAAGVVADISDFFGSSAFVQPPAKMSAVKINKETTRKRGFFILPHFAGPLRRV
jgi:hypothetical protein